MSIQSSVRARLPLASRSEWCRRSDSVLVWASTWEEAPWPAALRASMVTHPLGPTTSLTKKAISLIIGPHPASYQPTEPSSKATCRWP